jgi:hypothetical protein
VQHQRERFGCQLDFQRPPQRDQTNGMQLRYRSG